MTPREAINFFRTPVGAFLLFLALMGIAYGIFIGVKGPGGRPSPEKEAKRAKNAEPNTQVVETVTRDMTPFNPPKAAPLPPPISAFSSPQKKQEKSAELPPISLFAERLGPENQSEALGDDYAPFGRLVQCELVVTVDSSSISTPIIGLVTDDVYHNGRLIIPAGTEVHGTAKVDRMRERIANSGPWTFVWQTGEELTVQGIALDREKEPDESGWEITDGSAGLRGQLLKSDDLAEIKLFAATFLSGAASGLTEKEQTLFGSRAAPSFRNAPLAGAQDVLNVYARQILETIQRDGFYVRVPAGKQFYLYVTQTLDKSRAMIGGTRVAAAGAIKAENESNDSDDPLVRLRRNVQRIYSPGAPSQSGPVSSQPVSR